MTGFDFNKYSKKEEKDCEFIMQMENDKVLVELTELINKYFYSHKFFNIKDQNKRYKRLDMKLRELCEIDTHIISRIRKEQEKILEMEASQMLC